MFSLKITGKVEEVNPVDVEFTDMNGKTVKYRSVKFKFTRQYMKVVEYDGDEIETQVLDMINVAVLNNDEMLTSPQVREVIKRFMGKNIETEVTPRIDSKGKITLVANLKDIKEISGK